MAGHGRAVKPHARAHPHHHAHGGGHPHGHGGEHPHGHDLTHEPSHGHGGGHGHGPGQAPHAPHGHGLEREGTLDHPHRSAHYHRRARKHEGEREHEPDHGGSDRYEREQELLDEHEEIEDEPGRWESDPAREREAPGPREPAQATPPRRGAIWLLLTLLALGLLFAVTFIAVLSAPLRSAGASGCPAAPGEPTLPGNQGAPGQLGGIAGTGITQTDFATVRRSPYAANRITPGDYVSTAYGPPWGGIQGQGNATAGGLRINGGSPQKYWIAVDPQLIGHGTWVYLWPNPFNWKGPFLAADTGGAIKQRRIDFYDWRGRASQYGWGRRVVKVSATPLVPGAGDPPPTNPAPGAAPTNPPAATPACGGTIVDPGGGWGGVTGELVIAPGANAPGRPMLPPILQFMRGVAGRAQRKVIVTTGTNHSQYTTSGNVSDHWVGLGADMGSVANHFPYGGEGGTIIAAAALATAGVPADAARQLAARGGAHSVCSTAPDGKRWRVQIIWRSMVGGNHYDHVHVGLRQGCTFSGVQTS